MSSRSAVVNSNSARHLHYGRTATPQFGRLASSDAPGSPCDQFDSTNFRQSTVINNAWLPLETGTRFVWQGTSVAEDGDELLHSAVFAVTDLTREIAGVETVVCWQQDFVNDALETAGIVFIAQHDDGTVWRLGQYAEEYDAGLRIAAACWIHGINERSAEIMMLPAPEAGTTIFSAKWARSVVWTDRGVVFQVGQETTVPFGAFTDVLVINEALNDAPGVERLTYFARGVGQVRLGWRGAPTHRKVLELIRIEQLGAEELAWVRQEVLKLEERIDKSTEDQPYIF
jgi:hypothetical protein